MPKVSIENSLYERVKKIAAIQGYSSIEEFVVHALENAIKNYETDSAEDQVANQLRGLGYIN